jgi:hypothetical protein
LNAAELCSNQLGDSLEGVLPKSLLDWKIAEPRSLLQLFERTPSSTIIPSPQRNRFNPNRALN